MSARQRDRRAVALIISTWKWGTKYNSSYVQKLESGVSRWLTQPYEFRVFSPDADDAALTEIQGCFARLRMFSPEWQRRQKLKPDDRLVCLDLDAVITGPLDPLFDRDESFLILHGANKVNPCPYNGSVMMLRCGAHTEVWDDFSLEGARKVPFHEFPDDQGWIWHKLPMAAGWKCGPESGIYAFKKVGWPSGELLPKGARMVVFPGWRDPSRFRHLTWVKNHWR